MEVLEKKSIRNNDVTINIKILYYIMCNHLKQINLILNNLIIHILI